MLICVTNRKLCTGDFLQRIERIVIAGVDAVLLREKDLTMSEYRALALYCQDICMKHGAALLLNTFAEIAAELQLPVQLPMRMLTELSETIRQRLPAVGASVHSREEAVQAELCGADWLIAGHIFPTACKPLPPRGVEFLQRVCDSVSVPVYAIGGITAERQPQIFRAGAAGCCVMSEWMQCDDPRQNIRIWKGAYQ